MNTLHDSTPKTLHAESPIRRLCALFAALMLAWGPLAAQNASTSPSANNDEVVVLPTFSVSAQQKDSYNAVDAVSSVRVRTALIDTPNTISVITRAVIDDLGPNRIFDVTHYVAGVQEGRGVTFGDRQVIRGFEVSGRTVDNFAQNGSDNYPEDVIDRIEISKGPNAILSPAGPPGGQINVITKSPLYTEQGSITGLIGLFDAQKIGIDMTGPFSKGSPWAYRLVASVQDSRRYWSVHARENNKIFAPMLSYRLSDRTTITFKVIAAQHAIFRDNLVYILDPSVTASTKKPFLGPGFSTTGLNGTQPWSQVRPSTATADISLKSDINEHFSVRLAAEGYYYFEDSITEGFTTPTTSNRYNPYTGELTQDYTWAYDTPTGTYVQTFSPFYNPNAIPVRGIEDILRNKVVAVQGDFLAKYQFNTVSSQTVVGYALTHSTQKQTERMGTLPDLDLSHKDLLYNPVWAANLNILNLSSASNSQAYISQRFGFFDDRVFLSGGVLDYSSDTTSANALIGAAPSVLNGSRVSGFGSVLVKPRKNVSLYYSYSTNAAPTLANNVPLWRAGKQQEVGLKTEYFDKRLSFNVAYFKIAQTNVTIPNPERQANPNAPQSLIADYGDHGLEFELFGGITPNLSVIGSFSMLKLRDSLGRRVRGIADRDAGLLLSYRFSEGAMRGLTFNAGVSYSGRRPGDTPAASFTALNVVEQPSFYVPSYYLTEFGTSYRWKKYLFRLQIDNVLDDKGFVLSAGARTSGTGLSFAPGINVKWSTTYSF